MGTSYITNTELDRLIATGRGPELCDVRKPAAFAASGSMLPGAVWRDHSAPADWRPDLADGPVVVYCVHGHEVSQGAAEALRSLGCDARYLRGGFEGWIEAGYQVLDKNRRGS